jgi:hypothetical protein
MHALTENLIATALLLRRSITLALNQKLKTAVSKYKLAVNLNDKQSEGKKSQTKDFEVTKEEMQKASK